MSSLTERLDAVQAALTQAADAAGRPAAAVQLIAVSKTFPAADIEALYRHGQRHFGENYVQEWQQKTEALAHLPDVVWHFIGHLQSNKTRVVAERAHWLHTVDRLKVAERLSAQRPADLADLNVCLEVNISGATQKHGVAPSQVLALAQAVAALPRLRLRGLMCVPSATADDGRLQQEFRQMQALLAQLQDAGLAVDVLSMGMSQDMPLAVACGATHVRMGTAIFGAR